MMRMQSRMMAAHMANLAALGSQATKPSSAGGYCLCGRKVCPDYSSFYWRKPNRDYARPKGDGFDTQRSLAAVRKREMRAAKLNANWQGAR